MLVKTGAHNKTRLSPLRCPVRCHKTEAGTVGNERIRSSSKKISRSVVSDDIMFSDCLLVKMSFDFSKNVSVDIGLKSGLFAYPLH